MPDQAAFGRGAVWSVGTSTAAAGGQRSCVGEGSAGLAFCIGRSSCWKQLRYQGIPRNHRLPKSDWKS